MVPSVATNNRMVLKPSEKVPLSALLFADILYAAGLPPEMLSVVTGDPREIADEMLTSADVDLVTVQKIAGHVSPLTTAAYDRRSERARRDAVDRLSIRPPT